MEPYIICLCLSTLLIWSTCVRAMNGSFTENGAINIKEVSGVRKAQLPLSTEDSIVVNLNSGNYNEGQRLSDKGSAPKNYVLLNKLSNKSKTNTSEYSKISEVPSPVPLTKVTELHPGTTIDSKLKHSDSMANIGDTTLNDPTNSDKEIAKLFSVVATKESGALPFNLSTNRQGKLPFATSTTKEGDMPSNSATNRRGQSNDYSKTLKRPELNIVNILYGNPDFNQQIYVEQPIYPVRPPSPLYTASTGLRLPHPPLPLYEPHTPLSDDQESNQPVQPSLQYGSSNLVESSTSNEAPPFLVIPENVSDPLGLDYEYPQYFIDYLETPEEPKFNCKEDKLKCFGILGVVAGSVVGGLIAGKKVLDYFQPELTEFFHPKEEVNLLNNPVDVMKIYNQNIRKIEQSKLKIEKDSNSQNTPEALLDRLSALMDNRILQIKKERKLEYEKKQNQN